MHKRTIIYTRVNRSQIGMQRELLGALQAAVAARGDVVVAVHADDGRIAGRGKHTAWRALLTELDAVEQVAIMAAGDLPGRTIPHLLTILRILTNHRVSLVMPAQGVDTSDGLSAVLNLVAAYRAAKLSQAIRHGQARAVAAGKTLGRPAIPQSLRRRIMAALIEGGGLRSIGRRFNVSAATVCNIRQSMAVTFDSPIAGDCRPA